MNAPTINVLNYGFGNVRSVWNAVSAVGGQPRFCDQPEQLSSGDALIIPGVGAFPSAIKRLRDNDFVDPILELAASGKPVLGICLGMQLLFTSGNEHRKTDGLGLIPGRVLQLDTLPGARLPNIDWLPLEPPQGVTWSGILAKEDRGEFVYFVHSFAAHPDSARHIVATARYQGQPFTAMVRDQNVWGTQFHPEKSGAFGLKLLKRFVNLVAC
ncbi:MAG: imidazole glycerol phosphate synthase subunit HisH [Gammaproteobacteria bacterium]|nr:imidazole glycerol phosphate synthase subunit HisH [Gammaproteobacteria bacterium]